MKRPPWYRYRFPGGRIAADFNLDQPEVVAIVDLHSETAVALTEDDWLHLVERARYMRSQAERQEGDRLWKGFGRDR